MRISQLPALLSRRISPVSRDELTAHLRALHPHALNAVLTGMEESSLIASRPADDPFRAASVKPVPGSTALLETLNCYEHDHPDKLDFSEAMSAAGNVTAMQLDLINEYNGISTKLGRAWQTIISEFPKRHVGTVECNYYVPTGMWRPSWKIPRMRQYGVIMVMDTKGYASYSKRRRVQAANRLSN